MSGSAETMPMAPAIPGEIAFEVVRLREMYVQRPFTEFLALVADEIVKQRRIIRAAKGDL